MVEWHHWFDEPEFEEAPGIGDGQGSLACCSPWRHKESDMTERLNWTELYYNQDQLLQQAQGLGSTIILRVHKNILIVNISILIFIASYKTEFKGKGLTKIICGHGYTTFQRFTGFCRISLSFPIFSFLIYFSHIFSYISHIFPISHICFPIRKDLLGSWIPWMSLYFIFFNPYRISGKAKMITKCFNSSMRAKH